MDKFQTLRLLSNIKRLITVERGRFQGKYEFKWRGKKETKNELNVPPVQCYRTTSNVS